MSETTVIKWVCPLCGKEIESIYKRQMDSNVKMHNVTQHPEIKI